MYAMTAPPLDDAQQMRRLVSRRRGPIRAELQSILESVVERFARYTDYLDQPGSLVSMPLTAAQRAGLVRNYDLLRETGDVPRSLLDQTRRRECPMCSAATANTLDHYLPKAVFPEFSTMSRNLVPCCGYCNLVKADTYSATPAPRFFHPYYDRMPSECVLIADVLVDATVTVEYRILRDACTDDTLADVLEYHMRELQLFETFRRCAVSEVGDRAEAMRELYGPDRQPLAVKDYVMREARSCQVQRGRNDWKTCLYLGLSQSPEFCDGGFLLLLPPV